MMHTDKPIASSSRSGPSATPVGAIVPLESKRIVKLTEDTINRIAAGEVVQRPSSALKELLENSIDAGSTSIKVQARDGGLKQLSIQDNGSGIKKADLPLLCERFATSKLRTYSDLSSIATYGFRGEALASISHVAHVSVTTKTRDEPCGYKARYSDGKLVPLTDKSADAEPKPIAANDGTLILVEDLFYNTPTRRKALRSSSDEYGRILDVVSKYAIHNAGIAMSCKKVGVSSSDLITSTSATTLDVLGQVYSESVRKEMNELSFENAEFSFSCKGYVSGANYSARKGTFIFFINHRLVDCTPLKRNLEAFYTSLLPKGGSPFVYLSLQIHPTRVDVNVSPTKSEVQFLDQDDVIEVICEELQKKLASANQSRTFTVQTLLPGSDATFGPSTSASASNLAHDSQRRPSSSRLPPQKLVRTDASAQTLDAMFGQQMQPFAQSAATLEAPNRPPPAKRKLKEVIELASDDEGEEADYTVSPQDIAEGGQGMHISKYRDDDDVANQPAMGTAPKLRKTKIAQSDCDLTSIRELRAAIADNKHEDLEALMKQHTFVGTVDLYTSRSLLQHGTKLYLVNHDTLAEELFYQLSLRQFGALGRLHLKPPPMLRELIEIAVENEPSVPETGLEPGKIVELVYDCLASKTEMLREYFSLCIDPEKGTLDSIPMVLPGWTPNLDKLPMFLLRLGAEVDWTSEKECFNTFLREIAFCNTPEPLEVHSDGAEQTEEQKKQQEQHMWQLKHVVFPAMRSLQPPASLLDANAVVHVASLENLYKVFERC